MPAVVSPAGYLPAEVYLSTNYTGGLLIGALFAFSLMGVVGHMTWTYFDRFPSDRPIFKATVGSLLFLNVLHSAFTGVYLYQNLIDGFGDIAHLTDLKWGLTSSFTLLAIVACIVELFYAYRVYALLNRNLIAPVLLAVMAVAGIVFGAYLTVRTAQIYVTFPTPWIIESINWLYAITFVLPAAADLLIVSCMVFGLWRAHKLELPTNSWKAIRKVIFYAIETNTVTTVLALVSLAMFATSRRPIAFAICFNLPKVYAITLISSLLARQSAATGIKGDYAFDASNSSGTAGSPRRPSQLSPARGVRIACTTQTVVEKDGVLELLEKDGHRTSVPSVPAVQAHQLQYGVARSSSFDKEDSIDDVSQLSYA